MQGVTASVLAEAVRSRLEHLLFLHSNLTQVHSDLRREADNHQFPVFLLDFALLRTYVECPHARTSAFRTLAVLFRPGIQLALPPGASLELLNYMAKLADGLGPEFKAAVADVRRRKKLGNLLRTLPDKHGVRVEAEKLAVADDVLGEISEAFRSVEESLGSRKPARHPGEAPRDPWEQAESIVTILEQRVKPLSAVAQGPLEVDSQVYGHGLYLLASQKGRQQKTYNNRADALNLAVAHSLAGRKLSDPGGNGATPYFLLVTPDKAVYDAFSEVRTESVDGPIVRYLSYAFFRQLIASSPTAARHPEETAWDLRLATEEALRSLGAAPPDEQRVSWYRGATPGVIKAADEIWGLAKATGLEDDPQWPISRGEPRIALAGDFIRELERCAPTPSEVFLLNTLVRQPQPVEWSRDGRPTRLVMKVKLEPVAACDVAERYMSVWLESVAGFEQFLDRVNHIWAASRGHGTRIEKMFEGVDIFTRTELIEIPPSELPPPWTADDIWMAAQGALPLVVRMSTDTFDAWYEIGHNRQLSARCGVITHLDLYLEMSELVRECGAGKEFSPGECAASLGSAVSSLRNEVFVAYRGSKDRSV